MQMIKLSTLAARYIETELLELERTKYKNEKMPKTTETGANLNR